MFKRSSMLGLALFALALTADAQISTQVAAFSLVSDINPGELSSSPDKLFWSGSRLFFEADDGGLPRGLWITDGQSNTTTRVLYSNAAVRAVSDLTKFGTALYFTADTGAGDRELWRAPSASAGAVEIAANLNATGSGDPASLTVAGNRLYFLARTNSATPLQLWRVDSPGQTPLPVTDSGGGRITNALTLAAGSTNLFFTRKATASNIQIWSAGTQAVQVAAVPNTTNATAQGLSVIGNQLLVVSLLGGVQTLHDFAIAPSGALALSNTVTVCRSYSQFTPVPDPNDPASFQIFFRGLENSGSFNSKLWLYRKGVSVPSVVELAGVSAADFQPDDLTAVGSTLYLVGLGADTQPALWSYDRKAPTNALVRLKTFDSFGVPPANPSFAVSGQSLYFTANDGLGMAVWQAAGSVVSRVVDREGRAIQSPGYLTAAEGSIYFRATLAPGGAELWHLVAAQTVRLGTLMEHPEGSTNAPPLITLETNTNAAPGAVWLSQTNRLLFTEPGGVLTVVWSATNPVNYYISAEPAKEAVALYHTEDSSKAPLVDVSGIPYEIKFHGNKTIRTTMVTITNVAWPMVSTNGVTNQVIYIDTPVTIQGDIWVGDDHKLHAKGPTGYIVAHYESAEAFGGVEIIDVRPYSANGATARNVGQELLPISGTNRLDKAPNHAYVARGKQNRRTDDGYIYQHADQGPYNGKIFAVRQSTNDYANMEVFWMRKGLQNVAWPYEMNRFQASWPLGQRFLRSPGSTFPRVEMPEDLNPSLMPEESFAVAGTHGYLNGNEFHTDGEGLNLVLFESGPADRRDWVGFQVVNSVWHTNQFVFAYTNPLAPTNTAQILTNYNIQAWTIGDEITNAFHQGPRSGRIHVPTGDKYHPELYGELDRFDMSYGHIFAVNRGTLEVWWSNLILTNKQTHFVDFPGIQWPSYAVLYTNKWPTSLPTNQTIDIASEQGTGPLTAVRYPGWDGQFYHQNDSNLPGFNPNEEHAVVLAANSGLGQAIYALRNDLNETNASGPYTSDPFVLITHDDPTNSRPDITVFKVIRSSLFYDKPEFTAGKPVPAPMPLAQLPQCTNTTYVSGPGWRDRKDNIWARAAGNGGPTNSADIVMRYFYKVDPSFFWPASYTSVYTNSVAVGANVPWLDKAANTIGTPINVTNRFHWPTNAPVMKIAQTLTKPIDGLPEVWGQTAAEVIYQMSTNNVAYGGGPSVALIDPIWIREVTNVVFPTDVTTLPKLGALTFPKLPAFLRDRFVYKPGPPNMLQFKGMLVEPASGLRYVLPNIMTDRERDILTNLSTDASFDAKVLDLYNQAKEPRYVQSNDPKEKLALVAGLSNGWGFVTVAFNNSTNFNREADPISLEVIFVTNTLYRGEIKLVDSDNIFDETLTLRHSSDFAGKSGGYQFAWKYGPANENGTAPALGDTQGELFPMDPPSGTGVVDVTISSVTHPPLITLSDNYFVTRYRSLNPASPTGTNWSEWTGVALAEGWIKRVTRGINPYDQRYLAFAQNRTVNTLVSLVSQAGAPFEGSVALNSESADSAGLIEIYQTVLKRGASMSIESGSDYGPANDQLIFAASRLADLYMVLGNEAYADALNPTIGFGTDSSDYGTAVTAVHCFMNQTATLLEEELDLLRGRDDNLLPYVTQGPYYNRLVWNMSSAIAGGEVAYVMNYEVADMVGANGDPNPDGFIDENDAKKMYPQAHGDAWGQYLSAIKGYYTLLQNPNFTWVPRIEAVNVGGQPVNVDYYDERKFAAVAVARARAGIEILALTHRDRYDESPEARWSGYRDGDHDRAWGVVDWSKRAGQAAYWDWLVANSMLPEVAPPVIVSNVTFIAGETNAIVNTNLPGGIEYVITNQVRVVSIATNPASGITAIDRTSVVELPELASIGRNIQTEMDKADMGLSPLGLVDNVLPFDIDPSGIDQGQTHFEQIYGRAVQALANAGTVFDRAQASSQRLRKQFDSVQEFQRTTREREFDFNNRLIEIFGTPYPDDIGPTGFYPTGYDGPDYVHFDYFEPSGALGVDSIKEVATNLVTMTIDTNTGALRLSSTGVVFHISSSAFGLVKPPYWTKGNRRAVGEVQTVRSDLVQAKARFDRTLLEYGNLLDQVEDQVFLLQEQKGFNANELLILNQTRNQQITLNTAISRSRAKQQDFRRAGNIAVLVGSALTETSPKGVGLIIGFSNGFWADPFGLIRAAVKYAASAVNEVMSAKADGEALNELDKQQAKEIVSADSNIRITALRDELGIQQQLKQIEQLIRQEALTRLDLYTQQETIRQIIGRYGSSLDRGNRLLDEHLRFRKQTAAVIADYRYKDMTFRIFRDEALQKYRAQFDLAATYVYLAARAYDFETCFRDGDSRGPGRNFMRQIVKARAIGELLNGNPTTSAFDGGLADPMARMTLNWSVLKGQLGFNNPQTETGRFSLRSELFRILPGQAGDAVWRETLKNKSHMVDNILDLPEFQRYCLPFYPQQAKEPGIVITFPTTINFGHNFFGWLAGGGDNSYDSANFATKIRSVGVWFANYNNIVGGGMVNTPRVYLVPAGSDIMRSPTDYTGQIKEWTVMDQVLPVPFPLSGADLNNPSWIPRFDSLYGQFADIRKQGTIRAYHDSGSFNQAETISNSRLIGRSVWNTRWMLIIPAGTLHSDRKEGMARFVDGTLLPNGSRDGNGVKDIKLFFQTYSFEGM